MTASSFPAPTPDQIKPRPEQQPPTPAELRAEKQSSNDLITHSIDRLEKERQSAERTGDGETARLDEIRVKRLRKRSEALRQELAGAAPRTDEVPAGCHVATACSRLPPIGDKQHALCHTARPVALHCLVDHDPAARRLGLPVPRWIAIPPEVDPPKGAAEGASAGRLSYTRSRPRPRSASRAQAVARRARYRSA